MVLQDTHVGLLYSQQITEGLLHNRYASCFWHVTGFYWYDMKAAKPRPTGDNLKLRIGAQNGMVYYKNKCLMTTNSGNYITIDRTEKRPLKKIPGYGISGLKLRGKPSIYNDTLYVSDRTEGKIFAVDIKQIDLPKLLWQTTISGNPGVIRKINGKVIIPAGYQGMLIRK